MSFTNVGRLALVEACARAVAQRLSPGDRIAIGRFLSAVVSGELTVPRRGRGFDWALVASQSGVATTALEPIREEMRAVLDAFAPDRGRRVAGGLAVSQSTDGVRGVVCDGRGTRGGPDGLGAALNAQMREHGDTARSLQKALLAQGGRLSSATLASWRRGARVPRDANSLAILRLIAARYGLPEDYFLTKRQRVEKVVSRAPIPGVATPEQRRIAWHLPDDFRTRSAAEQAEILAWVREVVISGTTDYRKFQASALKHRYGLQFEIPVALAGREYRLTDKGGAARPVVKRPFAAPRRLNEEMVSLVTFKRNVLTAPGFKRSGVWGAATAAQRVEHLGLLLGAMVAKPDSAVGGLGVDKQDLTLALLSLPQVWDWYVQWREQRRGFYTRWEVDLLTLGVALNREGVGWLRQTPELAERLQPIPGLVTAEEIAVAQADWSAHCERMHRHGLARIKEVERVARIHRDPFEPILVILEADQPLAEYRKITEEIVRRMPNPRRYPKAAAEAVRAFLMLRIGLHTGLRQRNLRELMVCRRDAAPRTDRWLEEHRRGELRWSERDKGWEVYIPSAAFKNAHSSFFGNRPFRLLLPDLSDLYRHLDAYVDIHRAILLGQAADPGTFFVTSVKRTSRSAAYNQTTFYEAWRLAIQRYGIFNPYTGRGAIKGLLPHGPHNVRDVLATHILKMTGSYEQASYAIQDTPEVVAQHYGRFLPQDKASLAAQLLNKVWA